jgi:hypothetical protein
MPLHLCQGSSATVWAKNFGDDQNHQSVFAIAAVGANVVIGVGSSIGSADPFPWQ